LTRCPDAADLDGDDLVAPDNAAKPGTVCVLFSMSAANAAQARPTL